VRARIFYREERKTMNAEDLTEIERAGRRCGVCRSQRAWRRFHIVRRGDREPVVVCGSCRARFGEDPPVARTSAPAPAPAAHEPPSPATPRESEHRRAKPAPDRLRAALSEIPGTFSTAMAARAAGLSNDKTLTRLKDLAERGDVHRVGNRWSTESPPSDLAAAIDRLEARTSNLRIVRDRARVS
jgi:hypothetical protein